MCVPSTSDDHWSNVHPSRRTLPRNGCHTPTSRRASEDLPEPVGPITPRALPPSSFNDTSCDISLALPGGAPLAFSTVSFSRGGGRGIAVGSGGAIPPTLFSRPHLCPPPPN